MWNKTSVGGPRLGFVFIKLKLHPTRHVYLTQLIGLASITIEHSIHFYAEQHDMDLIDQIPLEICEHRNAYWFATPGPHITATR